MKRIFSFAVCLTTLLTSANAQRFQARLELVNNNALVFKVRPIPGGGNITATWNMIEIFFRWPNAVTPTFGTITTNTAQFPGMTIYRHGDNLYNSEANFTNTYFSSGSAANNPVFGGASSFVYMEGQEYEMFRVAVTGNGSTFQVAANNVDADPYYLTLSTSTFTTSMGSGVGPRQNDVAAGGTGVLFYGTGISTNGNNQFQGIGTFLPVRWLGFDVRKINNDALVEWKVSEDTENERFEVERSLDGVNFVKIADVVKKPGNGTKTYEFTDVNLRSHNKNVIHYRVKDIDYSGHFSYTKIVPIRLDLKGGIALYPNPAKDGFYVAIPYQNPDQSRVQLQLINKAGQVLETKQITKTMATNYYYNLNPAYASGDYTLRIFEEQSLVDTRKIVIVR